MNLLLFAPLVAQTKEVETQVNEIWSACRDELFSKRNGKPRMGKSRTLCEQRPGQAWRKGN